jgi:hypothetical protein
VRKLILLMFAISTAVLGCNPKMNSAAYTSKPQTFDAHQELVATKGDFFSYQFVDSGQGCTTGRHEFDDHAALCAALGDDRLNNYCAWDQRRDYYEQECH